MYSVFVVVVALVGGGLVAVSPSKYGTLDISYAPSTEMVINEGETQKFKASLCNRNYINTWIVTVQVFLQNVPWDSRKIGDNNWLHIIVSNKEDMSNIIASNNVNGAGSSLSPEEYCKAFSYDKAKWGTADMYITITASSGSPTYQYGLNVLMVPLERYTGSSSVEEATSMAKPGPAIGDLPLNILEQVAIPFEDKLGVTLTGQYLIPFCFEKEYDERRVQVTTLVKDHVAGQGAGGVATYLCTENEVKNNNNECFRSVVKAKGEAFYDASGAKVTAVTPVIPKAQFGVIYALVLAQGDYHGQISFIITAKLRAPHKHTLSEGHTTKVEALMSCMKSKTTIVKNEL